MNELEVLKDIYATLKKSIHIKAKPISDSSKPLEPEMSKFGGLPYLPRGTEYPLNGNGVPLKLLAQINCVDMLSLDPFPSWGLLQFYIDTDDLHGLNYNNTNPHGYKVLYIPEDTNYNNQSDLSFLKESSDDYFPVDSEHRLSFFRGCTPLPISHPDFEKVFEKYINGSSEKPDFIDLYAQLIIENDSHKMGGHPSFVQSAPDYIYEGNDLVLLLQIGHDEKISFGDAGIASFFIPKQDLKNLDFSNVLYHWDSH
jgi:uncharacterized protein YwqG